MEEKQQRAGITALDLRIAVSVGICCLSAVLLAQLGIKFSYGEMRLEILQKMTPCIACLLCCQDTASLSRKTGINRIIITVIGGLVGILVIVIDEMTGNDWFMAVLAAAGVLLTLYLCKLAKVPYINARIGGVTFILVACTLSGQARIWYGVFRLVSTVYAVIVVLAVTWGFEKLWGKERACAR